MKNKEHKNNIQCDIFEQAKFISQTQRGLHKQRQLYEFKVVFTILTFYVLATATVINQRASFTSSLVFDVLVWCFFLIITITSSIYLYELHKANRINIDIAENAERVIGFTLEREKWPIYPDYLKKAEAEKEKREKDRKKMFFGKNWVWQTIIMFIFAVSTAFIITSVIQPKQ
jgi:uncharacterized membrane protein YbhN (UPF0104 family)